MRKLVLFIFLFCLAFQLEAQVTPERKLKSNDYFETKINKPGRPSGVKLSKKETGRGCIVVVDNKIFDGNSEEFKSIPQNSIELVSSIKDSLSATDIKCILIYKSKSKK